MDEHLKRQYEELLCSYSREKREDHLYAAQQLSKWMMEQRIPPEEIISMHAAAVKKMLPDVPPAVVDMFDLLIEIMIGYGIAYKEHESLIDRQRELEYEIEVAVGMQQTLLPRSTPRLPGTEIGAVSMAANKMSGDYYNFVDHGEGKVGIALSDIIGKGIPAALCMSMIKYAMDVLVHNPPGPAEVLRNLNAVVERNVDPSMFITMVYGVYNSKDHTFRYATAGHEPGLLYRAEDGTFHDLKSRGLVLGVSRDTTYQEFQVQLKPGDAIILFSDGVTECRIDGQFLGRKRFKEIILKYLDKPAQEAVESIYQHIYELAKYKLKDDQTILLIRPKPVSDG